MHEYLSLVPGPTQVHPRVLAAMSRQVMTHLDEDWRPLYLETCEKLRRILGTGGDVFLMAASGTGAMEAAVTSAVAPGETILALSNGLFGERIAMIARSCRLDAQVLSFPTDGPLDPAALEARLRQGTAGIAAVGAVYSESQNGILNPIREVAAVCRRYGVPLIVDAVSAVGGVPFPMDQWGVDIAVAGAQKCLGGVVGMAVVAVAADAWRHLEGKPGTGFYFNLNRWRDSFRTNVIHPHPWSMSETLVYGLSKACDLILEEGLERRIARHRAVYEYYLEALGRLGFTPFVPRSCACPTVISVNRHPDLSVEALARRLKESYGILIGVGIYQQQGKIWRIGNMAEQARPEKARRLTEALAEIVSGPAQQPAGRTV